MVRWKLKSAVVAVHYFHFTVEERIREAPKLSKPKVNISPSSKLR